MNDFSHWTNAELQIQFKVIVDLATLIEEYGYVKRQYGISTKVYDELGFESSENAQEELETIITEGEVRIMGGLAQFLEEDADERIINLNRERFFPALQYTIQLDDERVYTLVLVGNERRAGAGEWLRFLAVLLEAETQLYQLERTD